MSIDMYLESAKSQATSLSSISAQCVQQNIELIKVLENFVAEEELKGHAYDSAKAHITSTVIPLIQGIVLYQESLAEECQKFVSQYTSDVDSKSWRQVDLEEKIREADQKISSLRQLMETKSDNKISAFLNLSVSIAVLEGAKQKLQKILISLLTFNAVSPTIFLNSERYLLAVQNGFAQAAQSWDAASGTYLPPSSGTDLSWKQTISLGWQKRQAILNKVKNPKVETLEEKLSKMSRAELEEEYGTVIQSYKRFLTMGQGDNVTATMDFEDVKLIWKRYNEVKDDHLGLLPSELAKVDPKFKKRIDAMDQEALEEAYPELKTLISMAHVNPYAQLFKSETERANYDYLLDRYFFLDSQKMLSWRDPAFQTKYDYYIIEEGIDPFTGKPATQEEIDRAKNIKKVRTVTESFQLASTLYTSYVGYNQYYNKPYTTFSDVYSKVKGKIPFSNRKPVIPEVNPKFDTEKNVPEFVTRNDNNFYSNKNYKGNPKAYINSDGYLVSVNPEGELPIHSQIRGSNPAQSPYISTTDPEFSTEPKNYGSYRIRIETKQLQHDIEIGKVKNVEVITHQEIVDHLESRVNQAKNRYLNNFSKNNKERLGDAIRDLGYVKRDGETLIKGSIPPEYFRFE
ncbi:hypothetical protein [Streptococcus parasanguinis]|uniref:hypothetical protein n=1 Tax=Streptococcus parasanguinis TaxID=1318 RepID=UPI00216AF6D1|nr:hypothetical protein [Streptococcus parasanguinis]